MKATAMTYTINLQSYLSKAERELCGNILPFWMAYAVAHEHDGFYGSISNSRVADRQAPRAALLSTRILWTFAAAYRHYPNPDYLAMAERAYRDVLAHFWDATNGGIYWMADASGMPIGRRKHIFVQAYGIYGLSEYARATGSREALDYAMTLFHAIEQHSYDPIYQGYYEAYSADWQLEQDSRLSAEDQNEKKTFNTHLHLLEAYTNLLCAWDSPAVRQRQRALIELIAQRLINPATAHAHMFLDEQLAPRSSHISFGHDIETSWLLTDAAQKQGDPALLAAVVPLAVRMAQATYAHGRDVDGSLFYEAGADGRILRAHKEWWPQAEAVVGFLNAYQLSAEPHFLDAALGCWDFIELRLVDQVYGEWFQAVGQDGRVSVNEPKVSLWKCPYHNARACLELVTRLGQVTEVGLEASPEARGFARG